MESAKLFNYGSIPRGSDRAKVYLYFREQADRIFEFRGDACCSFASAMGTLRVQLGF